jgi:hypothetical protein
MTRLAQHLTMNGEKEHMVFRPCHEPSKTPPKINLDSKKAWTNVPTLMRLEDKARRSQDPNKLGADADQDVSTMSYIVPQSQALGPGHHQ